MNTVSSEQRTRLLGAKAGISRDSVLSNFTYDRVRFIPLEPAFSGSVSSDAGVKVIPLKFFYYQTFWKLGVLNIRDMNIKECNKKMGSPCFFTRQQALKLGYFYLLLVKNSIPLLTDLSLCYLKHTKFYLEHKASFIQISSIATFNSV